MEVIHVELYWLMMPFGIISNLPQSTGSGSEIRAACSDLRKFGTASQFTWYPFWGIAKVMVAITELDMISEMGRSSRCRKNYLDREVRG